MTTKVPKNLNSSLQASDDEEDDDISGDEGLLSNEGRRRRFIIERKSETPTSTETPSCPQSTSSSLSRPKRARLDAGIYHQTNQQQNIKRIGYDRRTPGRRRRNNHQNLQHSHQQNNTNDSRQNFVYNSNLRQIPLVNYSTMNEKGRELAQKKHAIKELEKQKEQEQKLLSTPTPPPPPPSPPKGPVVYINPKFIKKFISKTIELANKSQTISEGSQRCSVANDKKITNKRLINKVGPSSKVKTDMIDEINLKTSPIESLQAASRMAIIRLVTECIEDDSKRDENLNKTLVSRLIDNLCQR